MRKKDSLIKPVLLHIFVIWCLISQAAAGVYIDIDELTAELESSIKSDTNRFRPPIKNHWDQIAQALVPKNSNFDSIPAESLNFENSPAAPPPPNNGWIIWPDSKGGLKYKKIPHPQSNYQKKKNNVPIFSTISDNSDQNSQEVSGTSYFPQYSSAWGNGGGKEAGNLKNSLSDGYHYDEYQEEFSDEGWKSSQKKKRKKKGGKRRRNRNRSKSRWQNNGGKIKKTRTKYFNDDDGYRRNTPNVRLTHSRKKKPVGWMKLLPKSWFN